MRVVFAIFLLFASGFSKQMAITFDDAPMPTTPLFGKFERVERLLEDLDVPVAFFCIGSYANSPEGIASISMIADWGHFIANHSYNHLHLSGIELPSFAEEIRSAEELFSLFPTYRMWFRFPYLDYGSRPLLGGSQMKRSGAFNIIYNLGYSHGYVTINTFDWYVNARLVEACVRGQPVDMERLKCAYLQLLEEWIDYFLQKWECQFQGPIVHTLLLHQNDLNTFFMKDVLAFLREREWELVSPEEAFCAEYASFGGLSYLRNLSTHLFSFDYIDQVLDHCFQ